MSKIKNIFTVILFLSFAFGFGQNTTAPKENAKLIKEKTATEKSEGENLDFIQIFTSVDVQAQPFGGINGYRRYITSSFNLPEVSEKTIARVVAKFVVTDDGSVKYVQILEETPSDLGLGNEAIRVLTNSRKWVPAVMNGKAVNQYYTLPISFEITPKEKVRQATETLKKEEVAIVTEKTIENNSSLPEKQAEPIGGIKKFYADLSSKIQTPEVEVAGIYKTKVKFIVNQDGSLSDYQILEETPTNVGLGQNVIKYLKSIQNWIPSEQNGKKVKMYFVLPVTLNIEPEIESDIKKKD